MMRRHEHDALAQQYRICVNSLSRWRTPMTMESSMRQTPDPVPQVVLWTMVIGTVSFVAGFAGPLLLSNSNLGPLLGIFVTGPLGFLVGGVVGALRVSSRAARLASIVIAVVWVLALAYTYLAALLLASMIYLLVPLHALIIVSTIYLLANPMTRAQLSGNLRHSGLVVIATQVIIAATILYPPVIKPWWGSPGDPPPDPFPSFAFVLDHGFQLSQRIPTFPQFVVNRPKLVLEWLIVIGVAFVLSLLIRVLRGRPTA
jgi:hypothetical protein